jgi:hypothetical protein
LGLVQPANAAPSRRHWNVLPSSDDVKLKLTLAEDGSEGFTVMIVSGGVTSTIQVRAAGVASVFPAPSIARTSKVCEPSASPE